MAAAAKAAGIERNSVYWARAHSPEFAAEWELALADAVDRLEAEAWKRALSISDTLLIFLLKAHRPALYRDVNRIDITMAIRQGALAMGLDPDEAVLAAEAIIAGK